MAHVHDVGALLVPDGEDLVGIFTERDYARKLILHGKSSKETLVSEIMSDKVAYVTLSATVDECMALMTESTSATCPFSPRTAGDGIVSIGDLVKATISNQQFIISSWSTTSPG